MQKMVKLTDTHYIVVDDSEIKEGDYDFSVNYRTITYVDKKRAEMHKTPAYKGLYKKITHSTQPLEAPVAINGYGSYEYISLQEVKELIGEVDVEKKAEIKYPKSEFWVGSNPSRLYDENAKERRCFLEGYKQALEDNKDKKYTEEDLKECVMSILRDLNKHNEVDKPVNFVWTDSFKKHIQSIQPKTEWEVEVTPEGKIILL